MPVETIAAETHDVFTYEVNEFGRVSSTKDDGHTQLSINPSGDDPELSFDRIFADTETYHLMQKVLNHVRATAETVSFPYRCDTETQCKYHRNIVFQSSSRRVAFLNKLVGTEERPTGTRWNRIFVLKNGEYICCSICNRVRHDDIWKEFQQLVDADVWPRGGKPMHCSLTVCTDCERGVNQRIAETLRSG